MAEKACAVTLFTVHKCNFLTIYLNVIFTSQDFNIRRIYISQGKQEKLRTNGSLHFLSSFLDSDCMINEDILTDKDVNVYKFIRTHGPHRIFSKSERFYP